MTPGNAKIGLVLLVYASPDVDGLYESPCDSAPYVRVSQPRIVVFPYPVPYPL
jgi:hypothetical protein